MIAATVNLYDPQTGELLMIMEGVLPTMYRTAAAAAVAVKHLARSDSSTLGMIGAGSSVRNASARFSACGRSSAYDFTMRTPPRPRR